MSSTINTPSGMDKIEGNNIIKSILDAAKNGQLDDLMDVLPEKEGEMLSIESQNLFSRLIDENLSELIQVESEDKSIEVNKSNNQWTSVLLTAINSKSTEICNFIIIDWTYLIQQLSFDHQVKISTAAYKTNKLDVLCDLLEVADYPFPENFDAQSINHDKLNKIITDRILFEVAIKDENIHNIAKFIDENSDIKNAYNINNQSALKQSVDASRIKVYIFLKFRGFSSTNQNESFDEAEKEASKYVAQQRKQNVNDGILDDQRSVNSLCNRSIIHNKKIEKEKEKEYRKYIRNWYEDINKIPNGSVFLNVVASCERLKIIFDFESNTVENVSLEGPTAAGSTYSVSKWIFIGAKITDKKREQKVKGVLAHELCHYVMRMVYMNLEKPYYRHRRDMRKMFEEIVKVMDEWSAKKDSEGPKDECNGIISSVYKMYPKKDFHPELIVRVVQILTEFSDNQRLVAHLEEKYKQLFNFWQDHVIPELRNYLHRNKDIIKLNIFTGMLHSILKHKIEIKPGKSIDGKLVIVSTNHPKLFFVDTCKNLKEKFGILMDSKNIFMDSEKLNYPQILVEFKEICSENQSINIFVDCTKFVPEFIGNIFSNMEQNCTIVVSNEQQREKLVDQFNQHETLNPIKVNINYNWMDLTEKSQNFLLQTKINFQNNSQIQLKDLLSPTISNLDEFNELVDDKLLHMLVNTKQIVINTECKENFDEKYFELLFEPRKFIKKSRSIEERNKQQILEADFLAEVKNQKHVLISDMAGNGKSWAVKNIANVLRKENPTNWVTYVDLKQFIGKFKAQMAQNGEPEFLIFMVEKVLTFKNNFEAKTFKKMYKIGKVFILFDGFDEIAPNYAKFVSKLVKNFASNGGNQLWIATRDFFEVDLKQKLQLSVAYSLYEMTKDEGVNMIARTWVLKDLKDENEENLIKDFESFIKMSQKYQSYQQKAHKIIKKALISRWDSVGLPQMFKMIADAFKDEQNVGDLQGFKIYVRFIKIMYKRWSEEKGKIRNEASIDSQDYEMNFNRFHQFHAILSLFLELAKILFPDYDGSEWPQEEIIACGILTIIDGKIYFIHETFREYFVADFIAKGFKKSKVDEKVVEIFVEILTIEKFRVIRVFLNDMIDDSSILTKIQPQVQKYVDKFCKMANFADFFTKNLIKLVDLVLKVLETENYEQVKEILNKNAEYIAINSTESKIFKKFQEFIFKFLKIDDLKDLIINQEVFQGIIESSLEISIFEDFVTKIEEKTDREFVNKGLMLLMSSYYWKGNIFYSLSHSSNLNPEKVHKLFKIMEKFLTASEIFELLRKCNVFEQNILQVCIEKQEKEIFQILWTELEKYFAIQKFPITFKEFVKQRDKDKRSILHCVAWCEKVEFHETFWRLLLKTFEDREELKDFGLLKDKDRNNFLHKLLSHSKVPAIIEMTFNIQKENFIDVQFQEILKSKDGWWEMNFLQTAAYLSKPLEVHQFLWKFFQNFCGTNEKFLKMLNEVDENGQNILHITASSYYSSNEIFEFMLQELKKITSRDEMKAMLMNLNWWNQNLLQSVAWLSWNRSSELHKTLWKTFREYFEKSEILMVIKNVDRYGNNILFRAVEHNHKEFAELTWNEIKSSLNHDELSEYLKMGRKNGKNLLECSLNKYKVRDWVKNLMQEYENEIPSQTSQSFAAVV